MVMQTRRSTADPVPLDSDRTSLTDAEIVGRITAGEGALFEILMRRYNQRVYRAARAVVKNEAEVEDVMQQAYFNAFRHLHQFERRSQFSTWLIRIVLNEAFSRRRKAEPLRPTATEHLAHIDGPRREPLESLKSPEADPERRAYANELQRVLEAAVDELPESYRTVFMLRDIEGLSTAEASEGLGLNEEAVKTRLHRARVMLRRSLAARIGPMSTTSFQFPATRCDRVVAAVFAKLALP